MEANPFQTATARSNPDQVAEACDDCGSSLTYNRFRDESVCDCCGLVSNAPTHFEDHDRNMYEANYHDQRAAGPTNIGGASTFWSLDGKDAFGSRIQTDVHRRMRRLNTIHRNSYRVKPQERRAQAFNEHLKPRIMALELDWTGEMRMLYKEAESMYLAVCGHMELRQLRNTNTLRSRYAPGMKWDILAIILRHEFHRDRTPLVKKISTTRHRYVTKRTSHDTACFVEQYHRLAPLNNDSKANKAFETSQPKVVNFIIKVLKAINQVFAPQNQAEFEQRFPRSPSDATDERCEALAIMVETVANAHDLTIPRHRIMDVHRKLLLHDNYPMIWSPNRLRSCHVEVTYWLLRTASLDGPTVPRTKVRKAITTETRITGPVSKAPQKAWGSMAQACVNEVMQHG